MATTDEFLDPQEVCVSVIPTPRSAVENRVVLDLAIVDQYDPDPDGDDPHERATEFIGRVRVLVEQSGGVCGPVRPGNATFTFAITEADHALNAAIRIQEALRNEPVRRVRCAIGLATGPTHRLEADAVSVLGDSVAAAHHLAEAANAGAVLADLDTIAAFDDG
jgi:class 3 adenylate cyclase